MSTPILTSKNLSTKPTARRKKKNEILKMRICIEDLSALSHLARMQNKSRSQYVRELIEKELFKCPVED
ncbi:MAG: ribbon-helix-helix protein, CopG family [Pseudomonadota bacterium]|nr:ribbon-helix-helix protein, CopG family [Pseudomonadota bacterium]